MSTESLPPPLVYRTHDEPAREEKKRAREKTSNGAGSSAAGMLWCAGWLFTIGFAKLVWWKALLALVVWPYFLGITVR